MAKKSFPKVCLVGTAVSMPERSVLGMSWREYLAKVFFQAIDMAGLKPDEIQVGSISYNERNITEGALSAMVVDSLGLVPIPFISISQACAGGGICSDIMWNYIASGRYDCGVVFGINKPDNFDFRDAMGPIGNYTDMDYMLGFTHENYGHLRSEEFKKHWNCDESVAVAWAKQCHWYGRRNPNAMHNKGPLPPDHVFNDPGPAGYRARTATGRNMATCIIYTSEKKAKKLKMEPLYANVSFAHRPGYIGNHYYYKGHQAFHEANMAYSPACQIAAKEAYDIAGITADDIDVLQVHDLSCFDALLALEGLGVCEIGQSVKFVMDGNTAIDAKCPTNTDGGAIAFGHSSAGGDFQSKFHENALQLWGLCGERQVKDPKVTVAQAFGTHHGLEVVGVVRKGE